VKKLGRVADKKGSNIKIEKAAVEEEKVDCARREKELCR
jgi:hypothetical protein